MKGILLRQFGGPEVLEYTELPTPSAGPGQVLVRILAIGVGKPDFLVRTGIYPYLKVAPPLTPGNEAVGIIEALGDGVTGFHVGQKVHIFNNSGYGTYAEYAAVLPEALTPLDDDIDPEAAVGLFNCQVAYAMLHEVGRGTDGKSIGIVGAAGGIGTILAQLALLEGMEVIAGVDTPEKIEYMKSLGVTKIFDCTKENPVDAFLRLTDGRGVDLLYDQFVGPDFYRLLDALADFGLVIVYNWLEGNPGCDAFPYLLPRAQHANGLRIFSFHVYDDNLPRLNQLRRKVFDLLADGRLKPVVYAKLPLADAKKAHDMLDRGEVLGKLMLVP